MDNVFEVFAKNTIYDKAKYLEEQKSFSISKNTDDILNLMKKEKTQEHLEMLDDDFSEYKEINFFINLKEQDTKSIFKSAEKYNDFQKTYTISREDIKSELEKNKKDIIHIPISDMEKKYAWYLEQKGNTDLQNINYIRNNNLSETWTKDIDYLDGLDKATYLKKSKMSNIKSELKNHKEMVIDKIIKLVNDFKKDIKENQKEYYRQRDFGTYTALEEKERQDYIEKNEEIKNNKLGYMDNLNFQYNSTFEENKYIISMLGSIGRININNISDFFKKVDNIDLRKDELIDKLAYAVTDKMIGKEIKENLNLYKLSDTNVFNFNKEKDIKKEIEFTLERIVTLKDSVVHSEFNKDDIKIISKDMKEIINDRENSRKLTIPYVDYEAFVESTEKDYSNKRQISDLINEYNYTKTKVEPSKINLKKEDDKIYTNILMPQFEMGILTEKLVSDLDDIDTLLLDVGGNLEIPIDLLMLQYINKNNPIIYNFLERESVRELGDNFYKDMIFDNSYDTENNLELEKVIMDKEIKDRVKDREKALGIEISIEVSTPEVSKDITMDNEPIISKDIDYTNIYDNREQVIIYLREIPFISDNLRMYEETIDNNYSKIYSNFDFETNVQNALEKVFTYLINEKLEDKENIERAKKLLNYIDDIEISNLEDISKQLNELIIQEEKEKHNKEFGTEDKSEVDDKQVNENVEIDKNVNDEIEEKKEYEL
jgi:hypothetical protein